MIDKKLHSMMFWEACAFGLVENLRLGIVEVSMFGTEEGQEHSAEAMGRVCVLVVMDLYSGGLIAEEGENIGKDHYGMPKKIAWSVIVECCRRWNIDAEKVLREYKTALMLQESQAGDDAGDDYDKGFLSSNISLN